MRTELETAGGFFLVRVGAEEVRLPELPYGAARDWSRRFASGMNPVLATYEEQWAPGDGIAPLEVANERAMDVILDLLVEYDRGGVLGGRERITERMSAGAIHRLYRELYEEAHPFDADLTKTLTQMAALRVNSLLAQSVGASSTNGSSRPGDSLPATSASDSPQARSNSSGSARRPATGASSANGSRSSTQLSATRSRSRTSPRASGKRTRT